MQPPLLQLVLVVLITFSLTFITSILGPLLPPEATRKGVGSSVTGLIFAVFSLTKVVLTPVVGYLIPRTGVKLLITCGLAFLGVSQILFGVIDVIDDTTVFTASCFAIRLVMAMGATLCEVSSYFRLTQLYSNKINLATAFYETSLGVSRSLGPLIGAYLFSKGGYQLPFYVTGSAAILIIPLIWLFITEDNEGCSEIQSTVSYSDLISIQLLLPFYGQIVAGINVSTLDPILEPHTRDLHLTNRQVSWLFTAFSGLYTGFALAAGYVTARMENTVPIVIFGQLGACFAYLFLGPSPVTGIQHTYASDLSSVVMLGTCNALAAIPINGLLLKGVLKLGLEGNLARSIMATLSLLSYTMGELIGTSSSGILVEYAGFVTVTQILASLNFIAVVLYIAGLCRRTDFEGYQILK